MPFDRARAQDDVTNYEAEWKALAWEAYEIAQETRAFVRAQAQRLAKLGALDNWINDHRGLAQEPFSRRMSEAETADHVTQCTMDAFLDHLEGDLAERVAECG